MAKRKRDGRREAFWRGVVKRQTRSGLSVRAFCRQEELAESNFYAWRRTIARRDQQTAPSAARAETTNRRESGPAFVPLAIQGHAGHAAAVVVERPDGLRLRFSESIAPDRLAAIVRALETEATP